jgi:membrane-associated phospholipid phosphatase
MVELINSCKACLLEFHFIHCLFKQFQFIYAGSFAGLGFLSLYLAGKLKAFDRKGHVAKLCVIFLPLLAASLVGISRVDDYWHHWTDVFAGGLIG